jgi:hypothetical protein
MSWWFIGYKAFGSRGAKIAENSETQTSGSDENEENLMTEQSSFFFFLPGHWFGRSNNDFVAASGAKVGLTTGTAETIAARSG